jgi:hypothetical protein
MRKELRAPLLSTLVAAEVVSAAFAWRDLNRRSDDRIRGRRNLWRAIILANPGNSIMYWAVGRR